MPKKKARDRQKSLEKHVGTPPVENSKSTKESHHHFVHHRHHHPEAQTEDGHGNTAAVSSTTPPEPLSPEVSPLSKPLEPTVSSEFKECLEPKEFAELQKIPEPVASAETSTETAGASNSEESLNSEVSTENENLNVPDPAPSPDSAEPLNVSLSEQELQNMGKTESEVTADSFETASGRSFSTNSLSSELSIGKGYSLNALAGFEAPIKEEPDSIPMAKADGEQAEKTTEKTDESVGSPALQAPESSVEGLKKEGEGGNVDSGKDTQNQKQFPVKSKGEETEGGDLPAKEDASTEGVVVGEEGGCREEGGLKSTRADQNPTAGKQGDVSGKGMSEEEVQKRVRASSKGRVPCLWLGWWISRCFDSDEEN